MHYAVTVCTQAFQLVESRSVLATHIRYLDGIMMDVDTGLTKISIDFYRICAALFAEKPTMFFDE